MKFKEILKYVAIPLVAGGLIGVGAWQIVEHVNKAENTPPSTETPAPDDNTGGQENPLTFNVKFKSEDIELSSQDVSVGGYSTLPEDPTKEGYNFLGYALEGTTEIVDPLTYPITENTVFVAVFEEIQTTSASLFTITDNSITGYTGTETKIKLPTSYSLDTEGNPIDGTDIAITSLSSSTFKDNIEIKEVIVPEGFTSVGGFNGCTSLSYIKLPESLTSIGSDLFKNCTSLESVIIPGKATSYVESIFSGCTNLKHVIFSEGIKYIGPRTFVSCTSLESVSLPSTITQIGDSAFSGCSSLKEISIPSSVLSLGTYVFNGCSSLKSVEFLCNLSTLPEKAFYRCSSLESVVFPNNLTTIDNSVFTECASLKEINIPEGVTTIKSYVFQKCINLVKVVLPETITSIGGYFLSGCTSLTSIEIPNSITIISSDFLAECSSLKEVVIPSSVTKIYGDAFRYVQSVIFESETPATLSETFSSLNTIFGNVETIYVPDNAVETYKTSWSGYAAKIKGISELNVNEQL